MSAIDRVMRAYASKYELTPIQTVFVRAELSKFIDELMTGPRRPPVMLPETAAGTGALALSSKRHSGAWMTEIGNVRVVISPA